MEQVEPGRSQSKIHSKEAMLAPAKMDIPGSLSKVGTLAGDLVRDPLVLVVFLGEAVNVKLLLLVVLLNQVLHDGARLPQRESRVGVLDG